jgi:hypothetical protein
MSLHRRAAKRDASERPIVDALRKYGFSVTHLSIPNGPDLLLGKDGISRVAESKTGKRNLRLKQSEWWRSFRGNRLIVLREIEQVPELAASWKELDQ